MTRHIPIKANGGSWLSRQCSGTFERNLLNRRDYPIFPKDSYAIEWHGHCSKLVEKIRIKIANKNKQKTGKWELPFCVQGVRFPFSLRFKKGCCKVKTIMQ